MMRRSLNPSHADPVSDASPIRGLRHRYHDDEAIPQVQAPRSGSRPRRGPRSDAYDLTKPTKFNASMDLLTTPRKSTTLSAQDALEAREDVIPLPETPTSDVSGPRQFVRRLSHQILESIDGLLPVPKAVSVTLKHRKERSKRQRRRVGAKTSHGTEVQRYARELAEDQEYLELLEEVYRGQHAHLLPIGMLLSTLAVCVFYLGLHFYLRDGKFFAIFITANSGLVVSRWAYLYWASIRQINEAKLVLDSNAAIPGHPTSGVSVHDNLSGYEYEPGADPMSRIRRIMLRAQVQGQLMDKLEAQLKSAKKPHNETGRFLSAPFADEIPFVDVTERFRAEREAEQIADEQFGPLPGGPAYASEMILDPHGGPGPKPNGVMTILQTPLRQKPAVHASTPVSRSNAPSTPLSAQRNEAAVSQHKEESPYLSHHPVWITRIIYTLGPIALMAVSPLLAFLLIFSVMNGQPTLGYIAKLISQPGLVTRVVSYVSGNSYAWKFWMAFLSFQILLMVLLPGKRIKGTKTKGGYEPVHRLNGLLSFAITLLVTGFAFVRTNWFDVSSLKQLPMIQSAIAEAHKLGLNVAQVLTISAFSPLQFYENLPYILGSGTTIVFGLCIFLYFKAFVLPTSIDNVFYSGSGAATGNVVFDFYSGAEMYPTLTYPTATYFFRLMASLYSCTIGKLLPIKFKSTDTNDARCWFQFQIKTFIHSRVGMTLWGVLALTYVLANAELQSPNGQLTATSLMRYLASAGIPQTAILLSALIQVLFVARHYIWEAGYLASTDIVHDHEGFYLAYGCAIFMPFTFTLPILFLVKSSTSVASQLPSIPVQIGIFGASVLFLVLNYIADEQKVRARAQSSNCVIWGKPARLINAGFFDNLGRFKQSHLLCSGFWGVARHFHFTLDWAWVLVSVFIAGTPTFIISHPILLFYPTFLLAIFIDRALRDDLRCARKYGTAWSAYREIVPYRMFPKIF